MTEPATPHFDRSWFSEQPGPDGTHTGRVPPMVELGTVETTEATFRIELHMLDAFRLNENEPDSVIDLIDSGTRWVPVGDGLCQEEMTSIFVSIARRTWTVEAAYEIRIVRVGAEDPTTPGTPLIKALIAQERTPFHAAIKQMVGALTDYDRTRAESIVEHAIDSAQWVTEDDLILDRGWYDLGVAVELGERSEPHEVTTGVLGVPLPCADIHAVQAERGADRRAIEAESRETVVGDWQHVRSTGVAEMPDDLAQDFADADWRSSALDLVIGDRTDDPVGGLVALEAGYAESLFGQPVPAIDLAPIASTLAGADWPGSGVRQRSRLLQQLLLAQLGPLHMRVAELSGRGRTSAEEAELEAAIGVLTRLPKRIAWAGELVTWAGEVHDAPILPADVMEPLSPEEEAELRSGLQRSPVTVGLTFDLGPFIGLSHWVVTIGTAEGVREYILPDWVAHGFAVDGSSFAAWLDGVHGVRIDPQREHYPNFSHDVDVPTDPEAAWVFDNNIAWSFTGYELVAAPSALELAAEMFAGSENDAPIDWSPNEPDGPSAPDPAAAGALVAHWRKLVAGTAIGAGVLGGALFALDGGDSSSTPDAIAGDLEDAGDQTEGEAPPTDDDAAAAEDGSTDRANEGDAALADDASSEAPTEDDADGPEDDEQDGEPEVDTSEDENGGADDATDQTNVIEIPGAPAGELVAAAAFLITNVDPEVTWADGRIEGEADGIPIEMVGISSISFGVPAGTENLSDFLFGAAPPGTEDGDAVYRIEDASIGFRLDAYRAPNVFYEGRERFLLTVAELKFPPLGNTPMLGEFVNESGEVEVGLWYQDGRGFVALPRDDGVNRPGDGTENTITALRWDPSTGTSQAVRVMVQTSTESSSPGLFASPHHGFEWTSGDRYYVGIVTEEPSYGMTLALSYAEDRFLPETYRFQQGRPSQTFDLPWEGVLEAAEAYRVAMG